MDDHIRSCSSHTTTTTSFLSNQDQLPFLLGHQIPATVVGSSSSFSANFGVRSLSHSTEEWRGQMALSSSLYSTSANGVDDGGEDTWAGNDFRAVSTLGVVDHHHGSLPHGNRIKSVEPDLDSLDCESEEGVEGSEVPAKPPPSRSTGSKRSRAAEVHNMSEKRRRSRINEKMKALQNLIPNSNKTDKASMLDEAIEYLKQLQLQVQMLSVRNGLNLHPMYLPGALQQPLQASQLYFGLGVDNDQAMNIGMSVPPPMNQDSIAPTSFNLSTQSTSARHSTSISALADTTTIHGTSFLRDSLQSHDGSFRMPVTDEEIFTVDLVSQQQSATGQHMRNLTVKEMSVLHANTARCFGAHAMSLVAACHLEGTHGSNSPQENRAKEPEGHKYIQNLDG